MILRKFQQFMYGRYGGDLLNVVLIICGMILLFIGRVFLLDILCLISFVFYGYALFRMFSKNISARQKELYTFFNLITPVKNFFSIHRDILKHRKTHKYFHCPCCKQWLRAPKGRGNIEVRCQKCGNIFTKKV